MKAIRYNVVHQYQPSSTSCSPTALSMLLAQHKKNFSVDEISAKVPQVQNDKGENQGTINQQMATWCISLGFKVKLYTFDCQVIDQSWATLSKEKLLERLEARKSGWVVPALGKDWTAAYTQSYIDFINAGGELHIMPSVTSDLIYELLQKSPVLPCLSFSTLYGKGRTRIDGDEVEKSISDDVDGRAMNHSVIIYGNDEQGRFLIADPWEKPGLHVIEPERMIAAISTGQIECDNLLFQLKDS